MRNHYLKRHPSPSSPYAIMTRDSVDLKQVREGPALPTKRTVGGGSLIPCVGENKTNKLRVCITLMCLVVTCFVVNQQPSAV